jgi:hypothetical protein
VGIRARWRSRLVSPYQVVSVPQNLNTIPQVNGRVIVDAFGYYKGQGHVFPKLSRHALKLEPEQESLDSSDEKEEEESEEDKHERAVRVEKNLERTEELSELSLTMCLLAPPRVRGFDLKTKEWCK